MADDESVVVYTTSDPYTAQVVRAGLEAEGIPCVVAGENQGGFIGVMPEISLAVPPGLADRAREVIARHPHTAGADEDE